MKSGFVSLVGRPNAGKSTLINAIMKQKIAIVTPKPQTTTDAIRGIYNDARGQIVFVDTPGIHKPHVIYGDILNKTAYKTIRSSDVSLLIVDASEPFGSGDEYLVEHLKFDHPLIIVLNKIDLATPVQVQKLKEKYRSIYLDAPIIETSAARNFNVDEVIKQIYELLEEGPMYYDKDTSSTSDLNFIISEAIREKAINLTHQEVPYSIAVVVTKVNETNKGYEAYCDLIVEKESQKGILIGKGAKMIKRIRLQSQYDLKQILKKDVLLEILVKVEEDWRNNPKTLAKLGLEKKGV
jgi:GTP-binding protein Era